MGALWEACDVFNETYVYLFINLFVYPYKLYAINNSFITIQQEI